MITAYFFGGPYDGRTREFENPPTYIKALKQREWPLFSCAKETMMPTKDELSFDHEYLYKSFLWVDGNKKYLFYTGESEQPGFIMTKILDKYFNKIT